jgi:hypothetical protein
MQLRRFVYHFAAVPKLLSTKSVAAHIMNKDLLEIFGIVFTYMCMYVRIYMYLYVYIYTFMHTFIYTQRLE